MCTTTCTDLRRCISNYAVHNGADAFTNESLLLTSMIFDHFQYLVRSFLWPVYQSNKKNLKYTHVKYYASLGFCYQAQRSRWLVHHTALRHMLAGTSYSIKAHVGWYIIQHQGTCWLVHHTTSRHMYAGTSYNTKAHAGWYVIGHKELLLNKGTKQ